MLSMNKYFIASVAAAAASLLLGLSAASALTVQPVLIENISVSPGEGVTRTVKLTNDSDTAVTLSSDVYDVVPNEDETGFPKVVQKSDESTLANWINSGATQKVTLKARETASVPVYITVPAGAEPGGHYALIAWSLDGDAPKEGTVGAGVSGQTGVNLAINVKGDVLEKGELVSFATADGKGKYDKLPIEFKLRVNNQGNRHFKPAGTVVVTNMFGKTVATLPVISGSTGGNVLPKSTRAYTVKWDDGFAFGKYTATAGVMFGKAGSGAAAVDFWILPMGLLVLWLVIAAVVVLILALLVKNIAGSMGKKA